MIKKKNVGKRVIISVAVLGVTAVIGVGVMGVSGADNSSKSVSTAKAATEHENGWEVADANTEHVYGVGSVSKVYSTAAVMKLVDEGKVGLDRPVTEYIKDFKMADPRYKDITVRMLMDHTSGLMGTSRLGMLLFDDNNDHHLDSILKTLLGQRLKADPGTYAAYCNDGFDLLGIIVERVSGMSFTEYVRKNLATPTGGTSTGTGYNYKKLKNLSPSYSGEGNLYEQNVCVSLGAGGVYSTASDTAKFGSAFFKGDNRLLSENAKTQMGKKWNDTDLFMDRNGLGWDEVEVEGYKDAGVKVLGKGGDVGLNHAYLLVAPDEKISVSVLANGGSSALNGLLSQALLRACMEVKGINIPDAGETDLEPVTEVPSSFDAYEGTYVVASEVGETINEVTFPEHKYMHVETIGPTKTTRCDYVYTKEGCFAELLYEVKEGGLDDIRLAMNPNRITFNTKNGKQLIAASGKVVLPDVGEYSRSSYVGERMEENPVSADAMASWQRCFGADVCLMNDVYSSENYDAAIAYIFPATDNPGYVLVVNGMGTRLLKIVDDHRAVAFQTIPSSKNRDLIDAELRQDANGLMMVLSDGGEYRSVESAPELDENVKQIPLETEKATWYRIGDAAKGTEICIKDRPKNSAVYVFNKFGEVIYTSHITDITNVLPMPEGGKVLFLGETGGTITLQ